MTPEKLLAIAALALSKGQNIGGMEEVDFCTKMDLETEYFSGAPWDEVFWYYYKPPNTECSGQAHALDGSALSQSESQD